MILDELSDVSSSKREALRARLERLKVDWSKLDEQFTRGGGKGGQKINKTSNRVVLSYPPLELVVRCQTDRRRSVNRFLALRTLADLIEMKVSPETSERLKEYNRIRKQKDRRKRRSFSEGSQMVKQNKRLLV